MGIPWVIRKKGKGILQKAKGSRNSGGGFGIVLGGPLWGGKKHVRARKGTGPI